MPRLKAPADEQRKRILTANMAYHMELNRITPREMALAMRVSVPTYYNRLKNPGAMTLDELNSMAKKFRISVAELIN